MVRLLLAALLLSGSALAQMRQIGAHKIDGSDEWNLPHATTLPSTCAVGDIYADSDAPSGARIYLCESANTWVAQGGTGTVTTTGTLTSGQVALGSGATSITGDSGLTWTGTGASFVATFGRGINLGVAGNGKLNFYDNGGTSRIYLDALDTAPYGTAAFSSGIKLAWSPTSASGGTPDLALSRASAGTLLVEDGSGNARDVQARNATFTDLTINGNSQFYGQILSGSVLPVLANTYNVGSSGNPWASGYFGTSVISPLLVSGPGKSGTNVAGTNNTIQAEPGTGSATGSSIIFQTPTAGASGTDAQVQATRLTITEVNPVTVNGIGTTNTTQAFRVLDSSGSQSFAISDDQRIRVSQATGMATFVTWNGASYAPVYVGDGSASSGSFSATALNASVAVNSLTVNGTTGVTALTESSATSFARLEFVAGRVLGAELLCQVRSDDGTDFQVLTSRVRVSSVRKATGNTISALSVIGTDLLAESAGGSTLSCTFTAVEGASGVTVQANCVSSLTQTTLSISFLANSATGLVAVTQL